MKMARMFSVFLALLIISSSGCLSGEVDEFYGEDISTAPIMEILA